MTALAGIRVLELTDESADYCGRILAGLGADVVKCEPAEGAPARHIGPFVDDEPHPDRSLAFWHDNVGKRSAVVDDDTVRRLCASADVLVHTMREREARRRGLTYEQLRADNPALVVCAVTPFGPDGPWADYEADDLVLMALGGSMAACGYRPGHDGGYDTPPLACQEDQAWRTASTYAAIAILAALWHRDATGEGQFVDVSAHECAASMTEWHIVNHLFTGRSIPRGLGAPTLVARDGRHVAALNPDFLGAHVFEHLRDLLVRDGVAGPVADPAFQDAAYRAAHGRELWSALERLAARHDGEELYRIGQAAGLPWGVVRSPEETLADRQLRARGHFVELDHPELGRTVTYSGAPFLASASPFRFARRPPCLGEHTDEVLAEFRSDPMHRVPVAGKGVS